MALVSVCMQRSAFGFLVPDTVALVPEASARAFLLDQVIYVQGDKAGMSRLMLKRGEQALPALSL